MADERGAKTDTPRQRLKLHGPGAPAARHWGPRVAASRAISVAPHAAEAPAAVVRSTDSDLKGQTTGGRAEQA